MSTKQLPSIKDIYSDVPMQSKQNDLNILLNHQPKPTWCKTHPTIKRKVNGEQMPYYYIPVERIEWLLTTLFLEWKVEIKQTLLIANSVTVIVRLHYKNPISGEWLWNDGIGACPLQTESGAGAIEFNKMRSAAVMMAAPAAESYAMKDAAEKIGKIFGKDLNRADQVAYDNLQDKFEYELKATDEQVNYITTMLHRMPDELRLTIENEMADYTKDQAQMCITMMLDSIVNPIEYGENYQAADIHAKLDDVMNDERK